MNLTKSLYGLIFFCFSVSPVLKAQTIGSCGPVDYYHSQVLDNKGYLDSWHTDENGPFHYILNLSANWWKKAPYVKKWPAWCTAAEMDRQYKQFNGAVPGSTCSFAIIACLKYYNYSGDKDFLNMAQKTGDYIVHQDLTPVKLKKYPGFPYAVGKTGDPNPDGSGHPTYEKKFNPPGNIQPDKGAMLGYALLQLYKTTGKKEYLKIAVNIADCLSANAEEGTIFNSPWPMRVMPDDNRLIDGKFDASVSYACRLFEGLLKIGEKGNGSYQLTRDKVWKWLKTCVIPYDDGSRWEDFFEDHGGDEANPTQINALETVRYLLEEREAADPEWFQLSGKIISQVLHRWALTTLQDHGYICIAEQDQDKSPYNSHTARLGSVLAMFYEAGADQDLKDIAYSSLCYGAYSVENDGFTATYFRKDRRAWTSDSFGDFIGHYLDAFAAIPVWAGGGNHLLRSTSSVKSISYKENSVSFSTFENAGSDKLKLTRKPISVLVNGKSTAAFKWDEEAKVLLISRTNGSEVTIKL